MSCLMHQFQCPICTKSVSDKCNSIQCEICNLWVHQFRCSGLTRAQFDSLSLNSDSWHCPSCINTILPNSDALQDLSTDSKTSNQQSCGVPSGSNLSDDIKSLLSDLNKVVTGLTTTDDDEDDLEIQLQTNSCSYVDCSEFNSILEKTENNFSAFHLNIASISAHFGELEDLLAQLDCNFSCIGISETKSLVDNVVDSAPVPLEQKNDFSIPGYEKFFTPTEAAAGGVSLYILESLTFKPRRS